MVKLKSNGKTHVLLNHQWNGLRMCIMIAVIILCCTQVMINASSQSSSTCKSSNCSLREWLITLEEEALSVECTLSKLQKSTALLSKVNYRTTSMRLSQIEEVKKTLSDLKGEIEIINSTCSTFYGPDCNITTLTTPECNSKCLTCGSSGQCSSCSGNWYGPTCSVCKSGWSGSNCNTPICSSNCASCSSPNICPTCKTGWYGSDCTSNIPPLILSSAQITKFTNTIMSNAQITTSKLLFKASRDGFSASTFHSKCDNKGPTIVIIKAKSGAIFGGYTGVNWQSPSIAEYSSDNSAFLFSLVSSTGVERFTKLTYQNSSAFKTANVNTMAIYNNGNYGPTFGAGHDIYIADNSNAGLYSHSLGICYTYCDIPTASGSSTAKTYMAGSEYFQVEDYEVYSA